MGLETSFCEGWALEDPFGKPFFPPCGEKIWGNFGIRLDRSDKTCDGWIVEVFCTREKVIADFEARGTSCCSLRERQGW